MGGSVVISRKINIVSVLYGIDGLAQTNVCINKATQTTQREILITAHLKLKEWQKCHLWSTQAH